MNRKELYNLIKKNNLQDKIKNHFGKNYTNVSTEDLQSFTSLNIQHEAVHEDIDNDNYRQVIRAMLTFLHEIDPELFKHL